MTICTEYSKIRESKRIFKRTNVLYLASKPELKITYGFRPYVKIINMARMLVYKYNLRGLKSYVYIQKRIKNATMTVP